VSVYGEMIQAFPELLEDFVVFKMQPRTGSGYGERYAQRVVRGYWSWRKQSKMGIEGDLQVPNHQATFWVQDDLLTQKCVIGQGDFVEMDGKIYRVVDEFKFSLEGGFSKHLMQVLAGPTDRQISNTKVSGVIKNDY